MKGRRKLKTSVLLSCPFTPPPLSLNQTCSLCPNVSAAELCKAMALLHTGNLDFAPQPPKLKGLELVSIPSIDLAADLSICIPFPRTAGFGCHLESNTCCRTQHSCLHLHSWAAAAGRASPGSQPCHAAVPTLQVQRLLQARVSHSSWRLCLCVVEINSSINSSINTSLFCELSNTPSQRVKALSAEFKFKCMTSPHE